VAGVFLQELLLLVCSCELVIVLHHKIAFQQLSVGRSSPFAASFGEPFVTLELVRFDIIVILFVEGDEGEVRI
jgi:hypothetical protein